MPPNLVQHNPRSEKHAKHVSCISGIFQFFEQQQIVTGRKQHSGPTRKYSARKLSSLDKDFSFDVPYHGDQVARSPTWYSVDYSSGGNAKESSCLENSPKLSFEYGSFDSEDSPEALFDPKVAPHVSFYKQERQGIWLDEENNTRNSPSILDSWKSTATFRETPRKSLDSSYLRGDFVPYFAKDQEWILSDYANSPQLSSSSTPSYPTSFAEQKPPSHLTRSIDLPHNYVDRKNHSTKTHVDMLRSLQSNDKGRSFGSFRDPTLLELRPTGYMPPVSYDSFVMSDKANEQSRHSSFDYNEAARFSEGVNEAPRSSSDSRLRPMSVSEIREEAHAHLTGLGISSANGDLDSTSDKKRLRASSKHMPNVIARLMGLENFPESVPGLKPKIVQKKQSKEAKLLRELLQYNPLKSSQQLIEARKGRSQRLETEKTSQLVAQMFDDSAERKTKSRRLELNETSKQKQRNASLWNPNTVMNDLKPVVNALYEIKEKVENSRLNHPHNEIEIKLRQLGLQSCQRDLKTVEQIFKDMHLKDHFQNLEPSQKPDTLQPELDSGSIIKEMLTDSSIPKVQKNFHPEIQVALKLDSFQEKTHFNGSKISRNRLAKSSFSKENRKQLSTAILKPISLPLSTRESSLLSINELENMPGLYSASVAPYILNNKESPKGNDPVNSRSGNTSRLQYKRQNKPKVDFSINEMFINNYQIGKWKHKGGNAMKQEMQSRMEQLIRSAAPLIKLQPQLKKKELRSPQASLSPCSQISLQKDSNECNYEFGMGCLDSSKNDNVKFKGFHHHENSKIVSLSPRVESMKMPVEKHWDFEPKESQTMVSGANSISSLVSALVTQRSESKLDDSDAEEVCDQHTLLSPAGNGVHETEEYHVVNISSLDQELRSSANRMIVCELDSPVQLQSIALSAPNSHSTMVECSAACKVNETQDGYINQAEAAASISPIKDMNSQDPVLDELEMGLPYLQGTLQSALIDAKRGNFVDVDSLYSRLKGKWETIVKQRDGGEGTRKWAMVDKSLGATEYYMKCRQGAMRCRLLLDCVNEYVGRMLFSDTVLYQEQPNCKRRQKHPRALMKVVWEGVPWLPSMLTAKAATDGIYTILERDSIHGFREMDEQSAVVANKIILNREIEEMILGDILGELVAELIFQQMSS